MKKLTLKKLPLMIAFGMFLLFSCNNKPKEVAQSQNANTTTTESANETGSTVKAEDGGVGFEKVAEKLGYKTSVGKDYSNPNSVKGGVWHDYLGDYPNVFRPFGPNSNTSDVSVVVNATYMARLIKYNMETGEYERSLADYWKFENDNKTLFLRLNPNVKFSDGSPLTADDVIATHELLLSEDIGDPSARQVEEQFTVTKVSDYIVKFEVKEFVWTCWMRLPEKILPASYLSKVDPKTFVTKYATEFMPGLGPYTYDKEKSVDQELLVFKRNPDWYGNQYEEMKNMFNFDTLEYKVIRDESVAKESFKKGELDWLIIDDPSLWHDELKKQGTNFDPLARNLIVKRMLFNGLTKRKSYFVFNSKVKPFDDIRVRRAFSMAFNKDIAIEKLMYNDAVKYYSITPISNWESPNLEHYPYSPDEASRLLDEAGYNILDTDGVRMNAAGERLELEVFLYKQGVNENLHTMFQDDLKKIGVKMNLQITDFPNIAKKLNSKNFNMIRIGMTGDYIPAFEDEYLSKLADEENTYNFGGYRSEVGDKALYDSLKETDAKKRFEYAHILDEEVAKTHIYMHLWTFPYTTRFAFWNRFNTSYGYEDFESSPVLYWSYNKQLAEQVDKAKDDTSIVMDEGNIFADPVGLKPADFKVTEY